ncbi:MAG: polysaccharide deacetylase family protein [Bacteroidales bacterium]|nr:polysaccharide deacetylase family protein [Bacteroidales bacterium]
MLLFYTSSVSPRLHYIATLLFEEMEGLTLTFTQSKEEFLSFDGPKVAYTKEDPGDGFFLEASGLLFEQKIFAHDIPVRNFHDVPILFESSIPDAAFPFDLLAASFYVVSRYEEYLSSSHDKYGRFQASSGMAYKNGFLDKPIVNIWLKLFIDRLRQKYPSLMTRQNAYRYVPTIDIDHAYAYLHRSLHRTMGGIGRSLSHGRLDAIVERIKVLAGFSPDPYDTFAFIRNLHETYNLDTLCFVLFADYGGNDNNITVDGKGMAGLMQSLAGWSEIGVHPSLSSSKHPSRMQKEKDGLGAATGSEITKSRQHFLKFTLPDTYLNLASLGIRDEYSMGYAAHPGFRAGIAHPFSFFDLAVNEVKPLRIHPVTVMDVTFRDYLHLNPEESLREIKQIIHQVRLHNGEFVSLWHNESLSNTGRWKGWRRLYEEVVKEAKP